MEEICGDLRSIVDGRWLVTDAPDGSRYRHYGTLAAGSADSAPSAALDGADVYNIIYRRGTTTIASSAQSAFRPTSTK